MTTELHRGDPVRVRGRKGYWRFLHWWDDDHTVAGIYGGPGRDPEGMRQHHAVRASELTADTRKDRPENLAAEHRAKQEARRHGTDR